MPSVGWRHSGTIDGRSVTAELGARARSSTSPRPHPGNHKNGAKFHRTTEVGERGSEIAISPMACSKGTMGA